MLKCFNVIFSLKQIVKDVNKKFTTHFCKVFPVTQPDMFNQTNRLSIFSLDNWFYWLLQ